MGGLRRLRPAMRPLRARRVVEPVQAKPERSPNWYKTARWRALRQEILLRDGFRCRQTSVLLVGRHPAPDSPVVDHIRPHRGDEARFWDPANLQAVSKAWHDGAKQAIEKGGRRGVFYPKFLRPSAVPLTVVCGPPAAGKSSFVSARAGAADVVICLDRIAAQLSGGPEHGWDRATWLGPALWERNARLAALARERTAPAAWFIVGEASAERRRWWRETLGAARIVVLETPAAVCRHRLAERGAAGLGPALQAVDDWWSVYRPDDGEDRLRPPREGGIDP